MPYSKETKELVSVDGTIGATDGLVDPPQVIHESLYIDQQIHSPI